MKIEVDEYYLNEVSEIIKITEIYGKDMFQDLSGVIYEKNGYIFDGPNIYDLIAHIPKQLLNHLVVEVNNYHTDNEFKQIIDNVYGGKNEN